MLSQSHIPVRRRRRQAMTLIELMTAISLLTLIILGLYKMFDQTQQALRQGANQVDVAESGRSAMTLMIRDLDLLVASELPAVANFYAATNTPIEVTNGFPVKQSLIDGSIRTNKLQYFFFMTKAEEWRGIGYIIGPKSGASSTDPLMRAGVGSLYRFDATTNLLGLTDNYLRDRFLTGDPDDFTKVSDGIIHMAVRGYTNGILIADASGVPLDVFQVTNDMTLSHIELELGVLDTDTLEQVQALPGATVKSNYLHLKSGNVQMFRRLISLPAGKGTNL